MRLGPEHKGAAEAHTLGRLHTPQAVRGAGASAGPAGGGRPGGVRVWPGAVGLLRQQRRAQASARPSKRPAPQQQPNRESRANHARTGMRLCARAYFYGVQSWGRQAEGRCVGAAPALQFRPCLKPARAFAATGGSNICSWQLKGPWCKESGANKRESRGQAQHGGVCAHEDASHDEVRQEAWGGRFGGGAASGGTFHHFGVRSRLVGAILSHRGRFASSGRAAHEVQLHAVAPLGSVALGLDAVPGL